MGLIWRNEKIINFGDFCHFARIAPNFYKNGNKNFWIFSPLTKSLIYEICYLLDEVDAIWMKNHDSAAAWCFWIYFVPCARPHFVQLHLPYNLENVHSDNFSAIFKRSVMKDYLEFL